MRPSPSPSAAAAWAKPFSKPSSSSTKLGSPSLSNTSSYYTEANNNGGYVSKPPSASKKLQDEVSYASFAYPALYVPSSPPNAVVDVDTVEIPAVAGSQEPLRAPPRPAAAPIRRYSADVESNLSGCGSDDAMLE